MSHSFLLLPDGDVSNDGWELVGASVTRIWEALSYLDGDDCYIRCPSYRGGASVKFPLDCDDLPEGAIIDSVTVFIRMRTVAGSGSRSVVVNVLSSDRPSRYTTRKLRATSDWTTHEVGTYTRDPRGKKWDVHRLNHLRLRVWSGNNLFDAIRISQLYCQVNYHTRPEVTVTAPSGTIYTPSPTIEWQYTQDEADPQAKADYRIFLGSQVEVSTFHPDVDPPVYSGTVEGEEYSVLVPTSLNADNYYAYVRAWSVDGAKSQWASKAFAIQGPSPGVPGDDNAGVSGTPGIGVPGVVPDSYTSSAVISMRDSSNLLSVQQADFEIPADPLEWLGTNCTVSRDTVTTPFGDGVGSLKMVASTAANMTAYTTWIEVAESTPVTARAQVKAAVTGRTVNLNVKFYDAEFSALAGTLTTAGTDTSDTYTEIVVTGDTPSDTRYAVVEVEVVSPASSEQHNIDHVGLMYGTNTAWSDGGHASRNLLTSHEATGDDPEPSSGVTWQAGNIASSYSRVTTSGTGAHGLKSHQMEYLGVSGSIAFRATGSVFTSPTSGTNFTLNKPSGTAENDLMIAFVTSNEHGTITPPSGWTTVNTASVDDGSTDIALWILKRTATSSEPSTWTDGAVDVSSTRRTAVVVAYSGAAHADDQFVAENVRTDSSGALVHKTATVNNTDPNAWRISAFAVSDNASGAAYSANEDPPQQTGSISYVGKASYWRTNYNTTSYTINKPSGVQQGDLMIAQLGLSGDITTITPPTGWTLVRRIHRRYTSWSNGDEHSGDLTMAILARTAGASEPNSWNGTHSDRGQPKITNCVAYRGADDVSNQFIDEDDSSRSDYYRITTDTVTNTDSKAWRVCAFGATTPYGDRFGYSSESRARNRDTTSLSGYPDVTISQWDSNGPVSTGNHSRTAELDGYETYAIASWIGLIRPLPATAAPGADETERVDNDNGSSSPWITTAVYDTNGVTDLGDQAVYGTLVPGSGTEAHSVASWIGLIKPADSIEAGTVAARLVDMVDIAEVDPQVFDLCGNRITFMSSFLGSTSGTPTLTLGFYRANQLISTVVAEGESFNTTDWVKSWATFDLPEGTTRILPTVGATGREIGDTVMFDRVGLMFGDPDDTESDSSLASIPVWRNGTARHEHPVWSVPTFEYADDDGTGYGEWQTLKGQKAYPPKFDEYDGKLTYVDHTIVPLHNRKYRVATLSYGLDGDTFASGFGPESDEASFTALNWWLKDIADLDSNMLLKVKAEPMQVGTTNTAVVFQALGSKYPLVITEGYKADSVELTLIMNREEHAALKTMIDNGRTLLLQSDIDHSWWVRAVGDLDVETQLTAKRTENPIRFVTVTFVEVEPEE